ncbi:MAG: hypothetical protein H3C45_09815 [Bacteroidia bacterium]|nr:hypothetical protein [Bacteroidia bacterium]MCZ2398116.1 hypothetical protein [Chitinophagales bacterium]
MLKTILLTISVALFSTLLIFYAYDISKGVEIPESSTRQGVQDMIVFAAKTLGVTGSWIVGTLATTGCIWYTINKYRNEKSR